MKRIPYTWHSAIQGIKYETLNYLAWANDIGEHDMTFDIDGTWTYLISDNLCSPDMKRPPFMSTAVRDKDHISN